MEIEKNLNYFETFVKEGVSLSEAMRFPTDYKSKELIIVPDAIDNAKTDSYSELTKKIIELLKSTNKVTKKYFIQFFKSKLKDAEVPTNDQL